MPFFAGEKAIFLIAKRKKLYESIYRYDIVKGQEITIYIYGIEKKEGKKMSIKKTLAVFLSILLVLSLIPAAVFAEAPAEPEEPEATEFTIVGWDAYEYGDYDAVISVKIDGEEREKDGWTITAAPGTTVSVEITLKEGYAIYEYKEGPLYWVGEDDWYEAGTSYTQVVLPDKDVLARDPELILGFDVYKVQDYEIYGYNEYNDDGLSVVKSVKLRGEELKPFGAGIESLYAVPGETLKVEVVLEDGYELGVIEDNSFFYWMIGENEEWVSAGNKKDEVILPDVGYQSYNTLITLCLRTVSSDIPEDIAVIDSVTINAPKIKVGDGWTMVTHTFDVGEGVTDSYTRAEPAPAVTVPDGAPYALEWYIDNDGNRVDDVQWMVKEGDNFHYPDEDCTFEYDTDYYIVLYLYATDIDRIEEVPEERAANSDPYRLFCINRPPTITVNNGELVDYAIFGGGDVARGGETRMTYGDFSPYMGVLIKVNVPSEELPPTSDMNPVPWVWTMVLALSVVLTAVYYEMEDIKRTYNK